MGEQTVEKTKEIEIQGDSLEKLYPIITAVASELYFNNHYFEARLAQSKATNSYAPFDVFVINPTTMSRIPAGLFTLLLLGNDRIMLRVPPRSRWYHDGKLTPDELIIMGLSKSQYDEHFSEFLKSLKERLAHYGLIVMPSRATLWQRIWQWLKSHKVLSIIGSVLITIITLLGINWTTVLENITKLLKFFR